MASVTARVREVKQPRGGYIKPSQFEEISFNGGKVLGEENVHASIIGMVVDYMTRYMSGAKVEDAFRISIEGYESRLMLLGEKVAKDDKKKRIDIKSLLGQITGLDGRSITAACKACTYDVWYRNPMSALTAKGAEDTDPDQVTIENIITMVSRSIAFWEEYGPVTVSGFTFEKDGYTDTVNSGDGDYLTTDTLWDFKVSKSKPTNKQTLQILMYWIMGKHSGKEEFKGINRLGLFNPRLNTIYLLSTDKIPAEVIASVENEVICY